MDLVLADLEIGGRTVKALMHAPKNGFFYVIDRATGKLVSAEPFARVTWATHVDLETGRPVETPGARYEDNYEEIYPSALGAHSWHPMSYNPISGLVYIPAIDWGMPYDDSGIDLESWRSPDWAFQPGINVFGGDAPPDSGTSTLKAWNPVTQTLAWERSTPGIWNAGTLTTAGNLVFQGQADGDLVAYAADSGEELWSINLGLGISAPPVTYSVNDRQYVSILVGWGGAAVALGGSIAAQHGWAYKAQPRRLVTFSLEGSMELPPSPPPMVPQPLESPDFVVDEALAARGEPIYKGTCTLCHGPVAVSGGSAPDLRASPIVLSAEAFASVLSGGARREMGMPAFEELTPEDLDGLRHYIRKVAVQQ
jgi:quinohemoprotein ethanol dehydrogenase